MNRILISRFASLVILGSFFSVASSPALEQVELVPKATERKVEVRVDGKLFTAYIYPDEALLKKPVLYPIATSRGTIVTRGFPLEPKPGERADHPHHVGSWFNYESVNGFDFWNNSPAIRDRAKYGTIRHNKIVECKSGEGSGTLVVTADWFLADGKGPKVLSEKTAFVFSARGNLRIIDRSTTLTAAAEPVLFHDVKDGLFAIRVARELEHPSTKPDLFLGPNGEPPKGPSPDNANGTGHYRSSEGIEGEAVWSTRARWMNLSGEIGGEKIAICLIDHPKNPGYPTYWHARGYGLFAANPLGAKIFSKGKEELALHLAPGESTTFRYRIVIASGQLTDQEIETLTSEFSH